MRKLALIVAALACTFAIAQPVDVKFKGTIDRLRGSFEIVYFPDGGEDTTVTCFASEAPLADGGFWRLNVDSAGPVTRDMPNAAIRVCKRDLARANRMDGGT